MRDPKIIHVVPRRLNMSFETAERCEKAFDSWNWLYKVGGVIPRHQWSFKRDASSIGVQSDLPFLKDSFEYGLEIADHPLDIILYTNDDVILHPMIVDELKRHMSFYPAATCRRVDIETRKSQGGEPIPPLYNPPIVFVERSWPHLGRDAVAFHAGWIKAHWNKIPDFLIGAPYWDIMFAVLVRAMRGRKTASVNELYMTFNDCEMPDGLVIHECHESEWKADPAWSDKPTNKHNSALFDRFRKSYCPRLTIAAVDNQKWSTEALMRYPKYLAWKGLTYEKAIGML